MMALILSISVSFILKSSRPRNSENFIVVITLKKIQNFICFFIYKKDIQLPVLAQTCEELSSHSGPYHKTKAEQTEKQ